MDISNSIYHCAYLFGGATDDRMTIDTVYKRNMNQTDWTTLSITTPTSYFYSWSKNSVLVDRIVYFIGTYDGAYTTGEIYKFDTATEQWLPNDHLTTPPQ
eukprot:828346_1